MKEQTKLKLNILQSKGVVSESTIQKNYTIERALKEFIPNIESLDTDFTFTHLAMALDRVEKNNQLSETNEIIKEQLVVSEFYNESKNVLDTVSKAVNVTFNEAESIMILLHVCNLVSQRGE
jgi:hypothetical protein